MTLEPYRPDDLDQLTLRVVDLAARLRSISRRCRDAELEDFALHDRKAQEWLARLDEWAHKIERDLEIAMRRRQGAQKAQELLSKRSRSTT